VWIVGRSPAFRRRDRRGRVPPTRAASRRAIRHMGRHGAVGGRTMNTGNVTYLRDSDTLKAHAVWETGPERLPGLIVVPDVRGLSDHCRDVAGRFAHEGFFALAVDLYSREGAPDLPDMPSVFRWIRALPDTRVLSDLAAAVAYLARRPEVDPAAIGVTGFCM